MTTSTGHDSSDRLFIHSRRPAWGVGLLVTDRVKRRSLQFQDGRTRTFAEGFYHLLEPWIGSTADRTEQVARNLESAHAQIEAHGYDSDPVESEVSFLDQLRLFRVRFPGGFGGDTWAEAYRRPIESRKAKRHVEIAVTVAETSLSEGPLRASLASGDYAAIISRVCGVLGKSSLASPSKDIKPLEGIPDDRLEEVATALVGLLHGDEPYRERLATWIVTLGRAEVPVRWELATLPAALLRPTEHPMVHSSSLSVQARILRIADAILMPSAIAWDTAVSTLDSVAERLRGEGEAPVDLLDVALFALETLRPSSLTTIREKSE